MKKKKQKKILLLSIVLIIIFSFLIIIKIIDIRKQNEILKIKKHNEEIINNYSDYSITIEDSKIFDSNLNEIGSIKKNNYLELDGISKIDNEYYKLKNLDAFIKYDKLIKTNKIDNNDNYKNYLPFNESIITNAKTKLYVNDETYYIYNKEIHLPIIKKEDNKLYAIFDNKLIYVFKDNANIIEEQNNNEQVADSIAVLNYHFVINKEAGEDKICEPALICHTDTQFDSHIGYMKENGYYAITMKELEMFIDGNINLPKKSVAITIDDGWFVSRAIPILEKYKMKATLFLIASLESKEAYKSNYLEVHSHTYNMHNVSNCNEGRSPLLCSSKGKIVEDLRKSRELLDNTQYFCYPFYEYNNNAIEALKEAGFTMALTGGQKKVQKGINKYKVPRYVIHNTTTINQLNKYIS